MRLASKVWVGGMLVVSSIMVPVAAWAQNTPRKLTGDVVRLESGVLQIKTASGADTKIKLADRVRISMRSPGDLARVQQGAYVGVTAAPRADGTLVASEVQIFPEALRGTGEGHRPMDAGNTMTNATVSSVGGGAARSTTTDATVAAIGDAKGERTLTVTYQGGQKIIVVPNATFVFATDIGGPENLVAGAHVVVYATTQADGTLATERVSVGKEGYVPPR
ncbi:MAG: DUF5666 domain-containing protein [Casimicrobiaceae bacterium]